MYARVRYLLTALVLLFSVSAACAQQAPGRANFAQQELDQMLAPIALYPDALLSQVLMAATYPNEVVEAARWSRQNSDLNGDRAVRAVERIDWDPSVKSLVAFPQILDMMDQKLSWTEDLGDAFLDQQAQVMDTVQYLRQQAYNAGNLTSTDQFRVDYQDATFSIHFSNPEMVYLPYYNPAVVYGTWWWPTHQPVYWAPWPGYYARQGYARGFAWGPGIPVSRGFFFVAPDWHRRSVNIVNTNNYYYRPARASRPFEATRNGAGAPAASNVWQHDTAHRRDVPYREGSSRQPAARMGAAPETRRDVRERDAAVVNGRGAANAPPPAAAAQPEMRGAQRQPNFSEGAPRGAETRSPATRGNDASGFEGRGANGHRPETRIDPGNRAAERANYPNTVAGAGARPAPEFAPAPGVAREPAMRSAPVTAPAQAPVNHPGFEQRQAAANAAPAATANPRHAEARAAAREHANHPAPADNPAAANPAGNNANAAANSNWQSRDNARADGGRNSRHSQQ